MTLLYLSPIVSWAGAVVGGLGGFLAWRYARAMQRMLLSLDDAATDAKLSGHYCRADTRAMAEERRQVRHLMAELQTALNFAPQPLAVPEFRPDDLIGLGPFPMGQEPIGGDGAAGHLDEEEDSWGAL